MDKELIIGLIIIALACSTAYYWFLARLYNARESNYKDQIEEALIREAKRAVQDKLAP